MEKINPLGRIDRLSTILKENLAKRKEQTKARQQKKFEDEKECKVQKNVSRETLDQEI
jgi:hypothetical protein